METTEQGEIVKLRYVIVATLMAAVTACSHAPPPQPTPPTPPARMHQLELKTNVEVPGLAKQLNGSYLCQQGLVSLSVTPSLVKHEVKETPFEGHIIKAVRFGEKNAHWVEYDAVADRARAVIINHRSGAEIPVYSASDGSRHRYPAVSSPSTDSELRTFVICVEPAKPR